MASALYEFDLNIAGTSLIAGVDEAGRGPLAGPVVASAVILDLNNPIAGINDSKKISENKRKLIAEIIEKEALAIGIGIVDHTEIDRINILNATKKAAELAIKQLQINFSILLTDALKIENLEHEVIPLIKGDSKSASIAAASIIAKVTRDTIMEKFDLQFPQYQFKNHKGYPTKAHRELLMEYGPCEIHRRSFSPVKNLIKTN